MKKTIIKLTLYIIVLAHINSCTTNDLEPTLAQSKKLKGNITKISNLESLIKGVHDLLTNNKYYGRGIIATNAVRGDNCFSNGNSGRFTTDAEFKYNPNSSFIWEQAYKVIANSNIIINTDLNNLEGDKNLGKHIQGQAYGLRALAYYDLLKTYGQQNSNGDLGVPIVTKFKGKNKFPKRKTVDEVKTQIYKDLNTAYKMMDSKFDKSKILISKNAIKALESRVAIYFGDWKIAKDAAKLVIDSGAYNIAEKKDFIKNWTLKNASNTIFELSFSEDDTNGSNSLAYIYRYINDETSGYGDVQVESNVINIFENSDVRKDVLGYQNKGKDLRNMKKYPDTKNGSDDIPLIRYEEIILNYAEALYELNNGDKTALDFLNKITSKRGASKYTTINKDNIILERRKELMFEGFRFDDLMRTHKNIIVLNSQQKIIETLNYPNNKFAYPITNKEINANSNVKQNNGY